MNSKVGLRSRDTDWATIDCSLKSARRCDQSPVCLRAPRRGGYGPEEFALGRSGSLPLVDGIAEIDRNRMLAGDRLQLEATLTCAKAARSYAELLLLDLA